MKPLKLDWRIVLVRPRNPLNIGAAARALANFGLREMAVVATFEPTWDEVRQSAVGGDTVIAAARAVPSLADILSDVTLVIGTTTGSRRILFREILPLPELVPWLRRRKASRKSRVAFRLGKDRPFQRRYEPLPRAGADSHDAGLPFDEPGAGGGGLCL